jgi:lysophospholipase L1-like esterase
MKQLFPALFLVLALLSAGFAAEPVKVACVGDSITAGYALKNPKADAYPAQLQRLLGSDYTVRNFGVSGATLMAAGDFPYVRQSAYQSALDWRADVVVIALGTNDTKASNIAKHPEDFVPSYRSILAQFRKSNPSAKLLICLPPPAFPVAMGIANDVLTARILPLIKQVAAEEHVPLIDLYSPLQTSAAHFPDKIHPDPLGAQRIAEIVYGDLMLETQTPAASLDPAINTATVPVPRLEQDSYNWWRRHAEELDLQRRLQPEIVLIGDSITHFWGGLPEAVHRNGPNAWSATFGDRPVQNLGFGWDRTQNVLWRLDHGELAGEHPKLVVINIGTNNLAGTSHSRPNSPQEISKGVLAVIGRVQTLCPEARILVMGVFPRGRTAGDPLRKPVAEINRLLRSKLEGREGVSFLEIGEKFLAPDGTIPVELMPDALHPSEKGYALWGKALQDSKLLP